MTYVRVRLAQGGRIAIPAELRRALGLKVGDDLLIGLEEGELRAFTPAQGIKRAQELVRRYVPEDRSLVDELIAERRSEAERE